uniref:Uncharacterized protein n=1 Tax=Sphaeramia orbicularis TaxID=375764 RepID=A0A673B021_9TELE
MVKIPSKGSARYLSRKYDKSEDYIRDNFLVLDIFFEALNYETIEQKKAYDVAGLLGDIGGQMGLFIGATHKQSKHISWLEKLISAGDGAQDMFLTLIMKQSPASAASTLNFLSSSGRFSNAHHNQ